MADRSMGGLLHSLESRLTLLERRLVRRGGGTPPPPFILPDRLSDTGAEVLDWDDALEPGFYWSMGAANQPQHPDGGAVNFQGVVTFNGGFTGRIMQELHETSQSRFAVVYRRYWNGTAWTAWEISGYDSDWVNLSSYLMTGYTGTIYGRVIDSDVRLAGQVAGSFPAGGTTIDFLNAIPEKFRASLRTQFDTAWQAGYAGAVVVRTNGTAGIANQTINWSGCQFSAKYFK